MWGGIHAPPSEERKEEGRGREGAGAKQGRGGADAGERQAEWMGGGGGGERGKDGCISLSTHHSAIIIPYA